MTTMFTEDVARGAYTVSPSTASGRTEVVTMPDVTAIVFVVNDDISVRESLELLIKNAGLAARNICISTGFPVPPARRSSSSPITATCP